MNDWGKYTTCKRCGAVNGMPCLNMHPTYRFNEQRPTAAQVHADREPATKEELEVQAADSADWARRFVETVFYDIDTRPSVLDVPEATVDKKEKASGRNRKWTRPTASRA